jgi:hypothetical protein
MSALWSVRLLDWAAAAINHGVAAELDVIRIEACPVAAAVFLKTA